MAKINSIVYSIKIYTIFKISGTQLTIVNTAVLPYHQKRFRSSACALTRSLSYYLFLLVSQVIFSVFLNNYKAFFSAFCMCITVKVKPAPQTNKTLATFFFVQI